MIKNVAFSWGMTLPALLALASVSGCNGPFEDESTGDEDDAEEVGQVSQAFTGTVGLSAVGTGYPGAQNTYLLDNQWQGFLTRVAGNFSTCIGGNCSTVPEAAAYVTSSSPFNLVVRALPGGPGLTVAASGWAIAPARAYDGVRSCESNTPGSSQIPLVYPAGQYACFLTSVRGGGSRFEHFGDKVEIIKSGGVPYIRCTDYAAGSAACVPISGSEPSDTVTVTGLGEATEPLSFATPGKVCGLQKVQGIFRQNSSTDGIRSYYDAGVWYLRVSHHKSGTVQCVW